IVRLRPDPPARWSSREKCAGRAARFVRYPAAHPDLDRRPQSAAPSNPLSQTLGEMLVAAGALTEAALREAQAYQRNGGLRLDEALAKLALVDETTLYRTFAKEQG